MFLVIDNYDSFTFNLVQYLGELSSEHPIAKDILIKRNDEITIEEIIEIKPDAILLSPGPGNPDQSGVCLSILKDMGAEAVLCHSWMESPENSSQRYLLKMGFQKIKEHPKFWYEIDYFCTRCGPSRCVCTAGEMIKLLD